MVSIILPNLNTPLVFLRERVNSILQQTFGNWECIVIDGFSENGSWELLREIAGEDERFTFYQKPPKGIYDAWNVGISIASGAFIYIATSDDVFAPEFLSEMTNVLDQNPDCDIAHCSLTIIDADGNPTDDQWVHWEKVRFFEDQINKPHKRIAPHDAVVHFGWSTVYTSIAQLLLRRKLFDSIGYFSTKYGSVADFEWGLRASLSTNTAHVPLFLSSWRRHVSQASQDLFFNSPEFYSILQVMANDALTVTKSSLGTKLFNPDELFFNYLFQQFRSTPRDKKLTFLMKNTFKYPGQTLKVIVYSLLGIRFDTTTFLRQNIRKRHLDKLIQPIR